MIDDIKAKIQQLKKERDAVILAHNYQVDDVQAIADYVGDSFGLSQQAAATAHQVIVFCGVHFMAEGAKILAPDKTVLLPEPLAGCPLADTIEADALKEAKKQYPEAGVVCYVNSSAAVKAESDICCTSSNAIKVVNSLPHRQILFVPDGNLAHWVAQYTDKEIIPWQGNCITHHRVTPEDVARVRTEKPGIPIAIHPECRPDVVAQADFVGSTGAILAYVRENDYPEMIIGTEMGIMYRLKQENPDKTFYLLSPKLICPNMKYTTLDKVLRALETMAHEIVVPEYIREQARVPLDRMLAVR